MIRCVWIIFYQKEVTAYFKEAGVDTSGMSVKELLEAEEVFALPDGRYLIVEV